MKENTLVQTMTRPKTDFVTKYPYAKINEFEFWVNIDRDGTISPTTIVYKKDGNTKLYNETGKCLKTFVLMHYTGGTTDYGNQLKGL